MFPIQAQWLERQGGGAACNRNIRISLVWGPALGVGWGYMGGCQNHGPFLGTLNMRCRIIIGIQKGTILFTTTHMLGIYSSYKMTPSPVIVLRYTVSNAQTLVDWHCQPLAIMVQGLGLRFIPGG